MDLTCMKTSRGAVISIHFGKIITTNLWDKMGWFVITDPGVVATLKEIAYQEKAGCSENVKIYAEKLLADYPDPNTIGYPYRRESTPVMPKPIEETGAPAPVVDKNFKLNVAKGITKFFSEFAFTPAIRFVNSLTNTNSYKDATTYIKNYMSLCDHPDRDSICEKIKSEEFKQLYDDIQKCKTGNVVNKRLEIYYGPAGTGKTTIAINENPTAKITVCNETMDSTDLMKVFSFNDENGNPVFKPSAFQMSMRNGEPHILDEINLLPMSTLRYLQGILDGKKFIEFEGETIEIKDGFKVIGTMNLIVNGQIFNLPEPIVDRASKIVNYDVKPEILADYAF